MFAALVPERTPHLCPIINFTAAVLTFARALRLSRPTRARIQPRGRGVRHHLGANDRRRSFYLSANDSRIEARNFRARSSARLAELRRGREAARGGESTTGPAIRSTSLHTV